MITVDVFLHSNLFKQYNSSVSTLENSKLSVNETLIAQRISFSLSTFKIYWNQIMLQTIFIKICQDIKKLLALKVADTVKRV